MHVHRTNHAANFTVLPNRVLQDTTLTFGARGLLGYLLAQPDGNRENVRKLADEHPEGRRAVSAALNELKAAGYYFVVSSRSDDGRIVVQTHIFDTPQPHAPIPGPGKPDQGEAGRKPLKNQGKETPLPRPADDADEADDAETEEVDDAETGDAAADEAAEPAYAGTDTTPTSSAVAILHRLGATEPRLRLGVPEALKLAPLVEAWLTDGATEGELRAALTTGLPRRMMSPVGLLKHRLVHKRPPAFVPPERLPAVSAPKRHECAECGVPVLQRGICRSCAGLGAPMPVSEAIAATTRGIAAVRAALRGYGAPALPA